MPENNNSRGPGNQVAGGYDERRATLLEPLKLRAVAADQSQNQPQQPEDVAAVGSSPAADATQTTDKDVEQVSSEQKEAPALPTAAELFSIPPYAVKIGKEIGKGAFSVVYAGEFRRKHVAVKCQPKDAEGNIPPFVLREVQVLSMLQHPRLLSFVGAADNVKAKQVWILSEFSNNGDVDLLLRAIRKGTQAHLGWKTMTQIALDAAEGIAFLQSRRIIHRDIKSSNILLDKENRAKLCDFGFATEIDTYTTKSDGNTDESKARRKSYCGTDAYMAPEMFLDEDYDESVDIFSYGVVLMEILCCRQANADGFLMRLPQYKFRVSTSEFQDALPASCPPALARLAEQCVAFEPHDRPRITDIVSALQGVLSDKQCDLDAPVELCPFTPIEKEPQIEEDDEYYGENDDDDEEGEDDEDEDENEDDEDEEEEDEKEPNGTVDMDSDADERGVDSQSVDDPFLDNASFDGEDGDKLQPLQRIPATPAPRHTGVVLKRNRRGNRAWSEKWFILDHDHLHYTDMPQPQASVGGRRRSNYVPPISSLSLRECRIWKTMEMPELRFNVIDSNWKIKRELQALNKADLEMWMELINQGIDYANELYASERDTHTSDTSSQRNSSSNGSSHRSSSNSRSSRERRYLEQQRQEQQQQRAALTSSGKKEAVVRKARRSNSDVSNSGGSVKAARQALKAKSLSLPEEEYRETPEDLDDEVYVWLKALGFHKYIATFRAKGFSSIDFIREVSACCLWWLCEGLLCTDAGLSFVISRRALRRRTSTSWASASRRRGGR